MASDRPQLPLYYRVFKTLEQRIREQQYSEGQRLPSEDAFCREFRVSRMTVRQALGRLVEHGLVTRRRGSGTYVGSHSESKTFRAIRFTGALEDLFAQVEKAQIKSVGLVRTQPTPDVRHALDLGDGEAVTVLRRVRAFDDTPFALTFNHVPERLGSRITERDLHSVPLLQFFEEQLGVLFTHAEQTVEARLADEDVANALGIKFGDPVLFVERVMFAGACPVELVRSHYRADLYRYQIKLVRRRRGRFAWAPEERKGAGGAAKPRP